MMSFWDMLLAGTVFAGALWYLYQKIVKDKGCTGCSSSCAMSKGRELQEAEASGCCEGCNKDNKKNMFEQW